MNSSAGSDAPSSSICRAEAEDSQGTPLTYAGGRQGYYPSVLASADAACGRAKDAYTIASAVAAAIVAAGVFGDFANQTRGTKVFAVAALVGWLAAAAFFIYAVGLSTKPKSVGEKPGASSFVRAAINIASTERRTVSKRVSRAQRMTVFAILITVAAIGWAIFDTATCVRLDGSS